MIERRILDLESFDDRVERAVVADVAELDALDVVGRRVFLLGDVDHLVGRHVEERRQRIDEAADQPRTRDAVDLGMLARHPLGFDGAELLARRQAPLLPAGDAAFEIGGVDAGLTAGCAATPWLTSCPCTQ